MMYVFLANGFEEVEAIAPIDLMRRADIDVLTVSVGTEYVTGAHGISVKADISEHQVELSNIDGIVLPGGMPGTLNLERSATVKACIEHCLNSKLPICAICAAPSILGHMGVLEGKRAVCFPGFEGELKGAAIADTGVCTDGLITTARGAGVAVDFGLEIVSRLKGKATADKLREAIICP